MIRVAGLVKKYGKRTALDGVSLSQAEGTATILTGSNGSGRSTLLRILAAVERPTSGEVFVGEIDAARRPLRVRRKVGFLSDREIDEPELTVQELLEFVASARFVRGAAALAAIAMALDRSGLEAHERVQDLSRGMKQQLAASIALLHDPEVLLMDEPLSYLDREGRRRLVTELSDRKRQGKTLVICSNEPESFFALADQIMCLDRGKIVEVRSLSVAPTGECIREELGRYP